MALRKSKGDAMASGPGIPARGGLHRPHSRFDQGKLPSLESSLEFARTAQQVPVIAMRPTVPAFRCFPPRPQGIGITIGGILDLRAIWAGPQSTIKNITRPAPAIGRFRNAMKTAAVTPPIH
jgi:hypothetical protein